jgi:signal transduction histidine kinase
MIDAGISAPERPGINAPNCSHTKDCPISLTACPGACVFADVMRSVNIGIVVFRGEGEQVIFQNEEAGRLLGQGGGTTSAPDLWRLLIGSAQPLQQGTGEAFSTPLPLRLEGRLLGYTIYGAGAFHWVFVKDVTEKARLEALAEDMEYMNSLGGVFSSVRHELGNPLNSMKMTLSVLKKKLPELPPSMVLEYADRVMAEMSRMEELLKSLKSFSMFESLDLEEVDLRALFDRVFALVQPQLEARGISLHCSVNPGASRILGNWRAMQQVLLNLILNAFDALEEEAKPALAITTQAGRRYILIKVSDNGPGIPLENQGKIFEPFFTTKEKGTGLGLVIAKKLVLKMNGTIEAETGPSGTTFVLSLPGVASA